jgi:rhomboid-like protein
MQRFGPSTALLIATIAGCILYAYYYVPPPNEDRLFPGVPAAFTTILAITTINVLVLLAWKTLFGAPVWRYMNKYLVQTPGSPNAFSLIGNIFSHAEPRHLAANTIPLFLFGLTAHDLVGRGDFIALFIAAGTFGAWFSMVVNVSRGILITSSQGLSGSLFGISSALCLLLPEYVYSPGHIEQI